MTDEDCKRLADERGYREEFCRWLSDENLIGIYGGQFAFPVHDEAGVIVSCHYRVPQGRWAFYPTGIRTRELVIGDVRTAKVVLLFESQWDAFAFMDRLGWDTDEAAWAEFAIIITRGAARGRCVRGLIPDGTNVVVVMQSDPPKADGSPGAAEGWLANVMEVVKRRIYVLRPPDEHKDLNDWTRAGATRGDIMLAWATALQNGVGEVRNAEAMGSQASAAAGSVIARREFPTDALGPILAPFVHEVARVQQVPEGLVGCIVLGVLSATLGKQLRGRLLPGKVTPPNLYILVSARSGVGKSEAARLCDGPLHNYSMELADIWRREKLVPRYFQWLHSEGMLSLPATK